MFKRGRFARVVFALLLAIEGALVHVAHDATCHVSHSVTGSHHGHAHACDAAATATIDSHGSGSAADANGCLACRYLTLRVCTRFTEAGDAVSVVVQPVIPPPGPCYQDLSWLPERARAPPLFG